MLCRCRLVLSKAAELLQHGSLAARHALVAMQLIQRVSQGSKGIIADNHTQLDSLLWCQSRLALLRGLACRCISVRPQVEADKQLGSFLKNCQQGKLEAEDIHHAEMAAQTSALQVVHSIRNGLKMENAVVRLQVRPCAFFFYVSRHFFFTKPTRARGKKQNAQRKKTHGVQCPRPPDRQMTHQIHCVESSHSIFFYFLPNDDGVKTASIRHESLTFPDT